MEKFLAEAAVHIYMNVSFGQSHNYTYTYIRTGTVKFLITAPKKNNSRRGLALELERKKSASIRVAPIIDCTLEP